MTHNIEASIVSALCGMTRSSAGPPVVYCVHTMMENELSSYSKWLKPKSITPDSCFADRMSSRVKRVIDTLGGRLDRFAARSSDGWIALTHSSDCVMKSASSSPGALIAPPIPDLRHRLFPIDAEDNLPASQTRSRPLHPLLGKLGCLPGARPTEGCRAVTRAHAHGPDAAPNRDREPRPLASSR